MQLLLGVVYKWVVKKIMCSMTHSSSLTASIKNGAKMSTIDPCSIRGAKLAHDNASNISHPVSQTLRNQIQNKVYWLIHWYHCIPNNKVIPTTSCKKHAVTIVNATYLLGPTCLKKVPLNTGRSLRPGMFQGTKQVGFNPWLSKHLTKQMQMNRSVLVSEVKVAQWRMKKDNTERVTEAALGCS